MRLFNDFRTAARIVRARRLPSYIAKPRFVWPAGLLLDWGTGNDIAVKGSLSGAIRLFGRNNSIAVAAGTRLTGTITVIGNGNVVDIGPDCRIAGDIDVKGNGKRVVIGEKTTMQSGRLLCQEGGSLTIGRHCMLSRDIEIRTTDAHAVINRANGRRSNRGRPVCIGDHVWIGLGALVGKGAIIPDDTIVAARAVVTGAFEEKSTMIAGVPAKIIRRNVTWNRGRSNHYDIVAADRWKG